MSLTLAESGDIQTGVKFGKNGDRETFSEHIHILGSGWHMKNAYFPCNNFCPGPNVNQSQHVWCADVAPDWLRDKRR